MWLFLGCFFELEELRPLEGLGGSGDAGFVAAGSGGVPLGGSGGGGGVGGEVTPSVCPPGQKDCGSGCVSYAVDNGCGSPSCAPCAVVPNASPPTCSGDTGLCQVTECAAGFADCDGDTASYQGEASGNGCEYAFGPSGEIREVPERLDVPLADIDIGDGSRDDWAGVPAYPLLAACENCVDDAFPDVVAKNEVPPRRDLEAYFRVAWDKDFLFVLGDVYDDALVSGRTADVAVDGRCQTGGPCEDALTVFVDGRNNRLQQPEYNVDDLRVFVALGGTAFRVSGAPVQSQELDFKATQHGAQCYRIEAQLSWSYLTAAQNGQPIEGQFPAASGQQYGFNLSINDWDPGVSDPTPRRETQLFWLNPGANYHQVTTGFGPIQLSDPAAPPSTTP